MNNNENLKGENFKEVDRESPVKFKPLTEEEIKTLSPEESEKNREWVIKSLKDLNASIIKDANDLDRKLKELREKKRREQMNEESSE
ncbi:MAG TPA: hypothetical protein PK079_13470 [Leptospiraceae bacterium]|nr:hypothetical protein [Leptospiraceae bacterium]HMW05298.1 hypothetical protein [Leptospiraceae bacterium]HMX34177.1 hypothetical protein [Leptospiraceae bacterium]HMY31494.1 hypothetical protein [Leptospiraceae bacterium]HMZ66437.1 hypothetical protein [Leptospiraceae bacterium]